MFRKLTQTYELSWTKIIESKFFAITKQICWTRQSFQTSFLLASFLFISVFLYSFLVLSHKKLCETTYIIKHSNHLETRRHVVYVLVCLKLDESCRLSHTKNTGWNRKCSTFWTLYSVVVLQGGKGKSWKCVNFLILFSVSILFSANAEIQALN